MSKNESKYVHAEPALSTPSKGALRFVHFHCLHRCFALPHCYLTLLVWIAQISMQCWMVRIAHVKHVWTKKNCFRKAAPCMMMEFWSGWQQNRESKKRSDLIWPKGSLSGRSWMGGAAHSTNAVPPPAAASRGCILGVFSSLKREKNVL
jgi:hypothetical protein